MESPTPSFHMDGSNRTPAAGNFNLTPSQFGYSTTNLSDAGEPMPTSVVTAVIYSIVFVVGLLGNTLVIYVVLRYAKMKTVTNMYILNLALADELYILGVPFIGTNSVISYWPYGEFLCKVCMTADAMSQFTSIFCLTAMSIDRCLCVVYPLRSARFRNPRVAKICNGMVWVTSFLIVLPITIYAQVQESLHSCNLSWPEPSELWSIAFILFTATVGFFGPLLIMCVCYLLIVIKMRSAGVRVGRTRRGRSERKATRMVVVIVLFFVFCWLPFYVANIVNLFHVIPESNATAALFFFLVILTYVNSCANPFLYGFLSDNFKQSFQKVLCCHKSNGVGATDQLGSRHSAHKGLKMEVIGNLETDPFSSKSGNSQ
ncbi:somatostatin receptor type 5-like [Betta splendens]|uniref:Somatostatin receptor type 5-like n=1 Tax=Betta splendens TaxID=158456 RepID=A0A6P7N6V6_BETSP|nr:somatostatin receptor type 5-like [Betta splendens]